MRFLFCLLSGLVPAGVAATQAPTVLVVGDSLSAAHNIAVDQGWVAQLQERLLAHDPPWQVVNASISGETSRGGRERLGPLLARHAPDIVVIELGANDGLRGLSLAVLRENLDAMITASREAGACVLLLGIELPVNYGPRYRDGLRELYAGLAREHELPLLPFLLAGVAEDPALMQADGLHPNAAGQPRVLANVWPLLEPLLQARNCRRRGHGPQ